MSRVETTTLLSPWSSQRCNNQDCNESERARASHGRLLLLHLIKITTPVRWSRNAMLASEPCYISGKTRDNEERLQTSLIGRELGLETSEIVGNGELCLALCSRSHSLLLLVIPSRPVANCIFTPLSLISLPMRLQSPLSLASACLPPSLPGFPFPLPHLPIQTNQPD